MRNGTRTLLVAATVATASIALTSCSTDSTPGTGDGGMQIVTTTTQVTDFVSNLTRGIDGVTITPLLDAGQSAHAFEATPADLNAISAADVVIANGSGLETWLQDALDAAGFSGELIEASEGFDPATLHEGHNHGDEDDHDHNDDHADHEHDDTGSTGSPNSAALNSTQANTTADSPAARSASTSHVLHDGHDHGDVNPHVWTAPQAAMYMTEVIAEQLVQLDAENADAIRANAEAYGAQLEALHEWTAENIRTIPAENRLVVTNHDALHYFNDAYHITFVGSIMPSWDDNAEPSAADLDALIANMKEAGVTAIFTETQLSPTTAETIAAQTGAKVYSGEQALYTDSLGQPGTPQATYIGATVHNVQQLMDSWGAAASEVPSLIQDA